MRHTLLPHAEKQILRKEYRVRASIVLAFALSVAGLIGIASLMPAFARTVSERRLVDSLIQQKRSDAAMDATLERELAAGQSLLDDLQEGLTATDISGIVQSIAAARKDVSIRSFSVSRVATGTIEAIIQGVAPTRDSLLAFKSRLESLNAGNKADLPLSTLVASKHIPYSIRLTELPPLDISTPACSLSSLSRS